MIITTFEQTAHPELSATVTQITQDVVYKNYNEWYSQCEIIRNTMNTRRKELPFNLLKSYYKAGLTPRQAVKKHLI